MENILLRVREKGLPVRGEAPYGIYLVQCILDSNEAAIKVQLHPSLFCIIQEH